MDFKSARKAVAAAEQVAAAEEKEGEEEEEGETEIDDDNEDENEEEGDQGGVGVDNMSYPPNSDEYEILRRCSAVNLKRHRNVQADQRSGLLVNSQAKLLSNAEASGEVEESDDLQNSGEDSSEDAGGKDNDLTMGITMDRSLKEAGVPRRTSSKRRRRKAWREATATRT